MAPTHVPHQLPPVDPVVPGARVVEEASRLAAAILLLVLVGATIAAFLVHVEDTVLITAFLEPASASDVRVREAGIVSAVLIHTGDSVKAGAALLELDATEPRFELERVQDQERSARLADVLADSTDALKVSGLIADSIEAAAAYDESRLQFAEAGTNFGIRGPVDSLIANYHPGGHVGMDRAYGRIKSAEAALIQAGLAVRGARVGRGTASREREADLHRLEITSRQLQQQILEHVIRAPYDGIIQTERPDLLLGRSVLQGESVLRIAQRSSWRARGSLPTDRASQVHVGSRASIELPTSEAFARVDLDGKVSHIGIEIGTPGSPQTDPLGGGVPVIIEIDDASIAPTTSPNLRAGLGLQVRITTRTQLLGQMLWRILTGDERRAGG